MRYLHYDVFTDRPFEGNQLAVVTQPEASLSTTAMQRIANEMAFSETTFVFPAEDKGDVKMRIFTPGSELPMAGHPTIGTTFALAREGVIRPPRETLVFECGVGPIPVALEWNGTELAFAWMTQPLPTFDGEIGDREGFAAAVGLEPADLVDLPIQIVSCGNPFAYVPLASRGAVDRVSIDRRALARVYKASGVEEHATFFFTMDRSGASGDETVYSRMLAPSFGITEDPATGSASGPLGCYMLYYGMVDADRARALISLQGVAMQRPSRLSISIDSNDGSIARVRVGGQAVLVAEGTLLARPG